jgi:DNA-binding IclR family transcriptional regulator
VAIAGVDGGAALNVSLPTSRATPELLEKLGTSLRTIAAQVEGRLAVDGG